MAFEGEPGIRHSDWCSHSRQQVRLSQFGGVYQETGEKSKNCEHGMMLDQLNTQTTPGEVSCDGIHIITHAF